MSTPFFERQPEITAEDLQDAIIRRVADLERVTRALSNDASPFLKEFAEKIAARKESIANIPSVNKFHAPKL